jgi:Lon protease-like protein
MSGELLPLFPLQVVLFPHTPLPLHIFEDRYKLMIGEAIANASEFGVVLAADRGIANTGCTAVVDNVVEKYPDGRMDILVVGRRRFEIRELNDDKDYLRGAVEFFDDEEDEKPADDLRQRAFDGYLAASKLVEISAAAQPDIEDGRLSFLVAQYVPDLEVRQQLLSTRSETERLKVLTRFFPAFLTRQRHVTHIRQVAPRNGHGHHPVNL